MFTRRQLLLAASWPAFAQAQGAAPAASPASASAPTEPVQRVAAAWRTVNAAGTEPVDHVGVLEIDWGAKQIRLATDHTASTRAHGITRLPGGGFVALAARPGRWLMRFDAHGQLQQERMLDAEQPARTLGGHAEPSADGQWLYTTETDPRDGSGWVSVRTLSDLRRVASLPTQGRDPHDLLVDPEGLLWVANGGLERDDQGRKQALHRMAPSLVQLDPRNGRLIAQHRLADPRLSIRHLAWAQPEPGHGALGVALQAEHDQAAERREAPLLAVWDGHALQLPSKDVQGEGYAGDIAAAPGGGFALSGQKIGRGLWWHPGAAPRLQRFAELGEPCALADFDEGQGVLLGAARGIARWHIAGAPQMLPWPQAMTLDQHWALLPSAA